MEPVDDFSKICVAGFLEHPRAFCNHARHATERHLTDKDNQ
jgi:hypothetical protein